jgi:hypothetical protein
MPLNPSIYRIDVDNRKLRDCRNHVEVITKIIKSTFKKIENSTNFDFESLNQFSSENINFYLHTDNTDEVVSNWQAYFPEELSSDLNLLNKSCH